MNATSVLCRPPHSSLHRRNYHVVIFIVQATDLPDQSSRNRSQRRPETLVSVGPISGHRHRRRAGPITRELLVSCVASWRSRPPRSNGRRSIRHSDARIP